MYSGTINVHAKLWRDGGNPAQVAVDLLLQAEAKMLGKFVPVCSGEQRYSDCNCLTPLAISLCALIFVRNSSSTMQIHIYDEHKVKMSSCHWTEIEIVLRWLHSRAEPLAEPQLAVTYDSRAEPSRAIKLPAKCGLAASWLQLNHIAKNLVFS